MKDQATKLKLIALGLALVSAIMGAYIVVQFVKTSKTQPTVIKPTVQPTPPPDPGRAFADVTANASSVNRGDTWHLTITTNTWSKCVVDMYRPDSTPIIWKDPKQGDAAFASPGKFAWDWKFAPDAPVGTWSARVLCGTFDNLFVREVTVELH
jgi:hypothetical protein